MFIPGNNPGMIRDANIYGADSIMFDLEDSVAYTEKDAARLLVYNALKTLDFGSKETVVRINDLSSITALYIHRMNITIGKQIIGFEAEAMDLMNSFPWPGNLDQLHHVIKELVVITQTPYITYADTKAILDAEPAISCNDPQTTLNLSATLDEMNYQIIQWVLAEEHGNKEKTAKRLGISRSTLWRMLKK